MARMSNRTARIVKWSALPAALLVSGLVVSQASYSAFTATTSTPQNNWKSGSLTLTDDDKGAALFEVNNIKPGDWGSKCIAVTAGTIEDSSVNMSVQDLTADKVAAAPMANNLKLTVTQPEGECIAGGPAKTNGTALVAAGAAGAPALTNTWKPATGTSTQSYLIEWYFDINANNLPASDASGKTVSASFVWTADQGAGKQITPTATP